MVKVWSWSHGVCLCWLCDWL